VKTVEEGKETLLGLDRIRHARGKNSREIVGCKGDRGVIDDPRRLPHARQTLEVTSPTDGFIAATQCEQLGVACVVLGGGREKKETQSIGRRARVSQTHWRRRETRRAALHAALQRSRAPCRSAALGRDGLSDRTEKPKAIPPLIHRVIGAGNR